jgi:diaminopimelate epimerase
MRIPFTKAHGAGNDFALTWSADAPSGDLPEIARALCDRHTGVGADGWLLVRATPTGPTRRFACSTPMAASRNCPAMALVAPPRSSWIRAS